MDNKLKFTQQDEQHFLKLGHPQSDMRQLKAAFREVRLELYDYKMKENRKIKRAEAIEILGREVFLNCISRCAFHATTSANNKDNTLNVRFSLLHWW